MNLKTKIIFTLLAITGSLSVYAQTSKYDKQLADSLGADDYGMKRYVLVMLKEGSLTEGNKAKRDSIFGGHMKNIVRLAGEGKLIVAGPLQKNEKTYQGIFILNVKTIDEAKTLVDTDPAIQAKLLDAEFYGWYGSAALPLYLPGVEKVTRKNF